jgi:superfamily II DNA/RNA helicase
MTATLQPSSVAELAKTVGRKGFSESLFLSPKRQALSVCMKMTTDPRSWIVEDLERQPQNQRAIVYCLYKRNVELMAEMLKSKMPKRVVLECVSGSTADLSKFKSTFSIMVCTSVLIAGISIDGITRVYFLDCANGPEGFLQGAGRGARAEGETCVATLVTCKSQLQYFMYSDQTMTSHMATFCYSCYERNLDFAEELYKLFQHAAPAPGRFNQHAVSVGQGRTKLRCSDCRLDQCPQCAADEQNFQKGLERDLSQQPRLLRDLTEMSGGGKVSSEYVSTISLSGA